MYSTRVSILKGLGMSKSTMCGLLILLACATSELAFNDLPRVWGEEPTAKSTKPVRRVPPYYAQIGLTTDQRERIRVVQDKYAPGIDKLEQQLAELRSRQKTDLEAVLTAEQKMKLTQLRNGAKTKDKSSTGT